MPKSVFRRLIAFVALIVGIGVASASVSAADAAPVTHHVTHQVTHHGSVTPDDWYW